MRRKLRRFIRRLRGGTGRPRLVPCDAPLVLISQIQRSGGTLLCRLFDDHPNLFVYPDELRWGRPNKWDWPDFRGLERPNSSELWRHLYNSFLDRALVESYRKGEFSAPLPFRFDRRLHRRLFRAAIAGGVRTQRDVLDSHMTSFFNAWLDYQNLYRGPKRFTVAFTPRVSMYPEHVARFFRDYPDGAMISVLRDPLSWLASAKRHARSQKDMRDKSATNLLEFWKASTNALIENHDRDPERCLVALYEDLVLRTEGAMRRLCGRLGIPYHPTLVVPTLNSLPVCSNTSHAELGREEGVSSRSLEHYKEVLSPSDVETARSACGDLYRRAARTALSPEPVGTPEPGDGLKSGTFSR